MKYTTITVEQELLLHQMSFQLLHALTTNHCICLYKMHNKSFVDGCNWLLEDEKHSSTNASGAHAWHVTHSVAPP